MANINILYVTMLIASIRTFFFFFKDFKLSVILKDYSIVLFLRLTLIINVKLLCIFNCIFFFFYLKILYEYVLYYCVFSKSTACADGPLNKFYLFSYNFYNAQF
jgi:hypothetical protein